MLWPALQTKTEQTVRMLLQDRKRKVAGNFQSISKPSSLTALADPHRRVPPAPTMGKATGTTTAAKKTNKKEEDALREKGFKVGDEVSVMIGSGAFSTMAMSRPDHLGA